MSSFHCDIRNTKTRVLFFAVHRSQIEETRQKTASRLGHAFKNTSIIDHERFAFYPDLFFAVLIFSLTCRRGFVPTAIQGILLSIKSHHSAFTMPRKDTSFSYVSRIMDSVLLLMLLTFKSASLSRS